MTADDKSRTYGDANPSFTASYTGFKNLTLTLGVKNLMDTNPPFTNSNLTFQGGYDPSYYDARARFVYGSVRYAFK